MMMVSFSAEGAHWGEDDWEACEVAIVDIPISLELKNSIMFNMFNMFNKSYEK